MREALAPYVGQRITISGRVQRFGTRLGWDGSKLPTLLIRPVQDDHGQEICDHLWLRVGQRIALADPQPGDVLTLTGRVRQYTKRRKPVGPGPALTERDLGLAYPTRCAVVGKAGRVADSATLLPNPAETVNPGSQEICAIAQDQAAGVAENVCLSTQTPVSLTQVRELAPPRESVDRSHRVTVPSGDMPARARILFALAVLSLEFPQGVSLSRLNHHAGVPPTTFISQLKKLGSAGDISFTPTGRVLLVNQPTTSAIGVAQ